MLKRITLMVGSLLVVFVATQAGANEVLMNNMKKTSIDVEYRLAYPNPGQVAYFSEIKSARIKNNFFNHDYFYYSNAYYCVDFISCTRRFKKSILGFGFNILSSAYKIQIMYHMTWPIKILGLCLDMLPTLFLAYVFIVLFRLFSAFEKGQIFELENVKKIRNIGVGLLVNQLLNPISEAFITTLLS